MTKVLLLILLLFVLVCAACSHSESAAPPAATANAQPSAPAASPAASPSAMAVAPTLAMPTPGSPVVPKAKDNPKDAKGLPQNLPPAIGDRLYRALTLEEINQLPPATREAILRAQGRWPGSPTPAPKKK